LLPNSYQNKAEVKIMLTIKKILYFVIIIGISLFLFTGCELLLDLFSEDEYIQFNDSW